jgi:hypothetical protein
LTVSSRPGLSTGRRRCWRDAEMLFVVRRAERAVGSSTNDAASEARS